MSTQLITVLEDDVVSKVRDIFDHHNFHHVLVTDVSGQLVGIISKQDLLRFTESVDLDKKGNGQMYSQFYALKAFEIMTANPMALEQEDTVGLAADIFLANKFHALPVVDGNELVGIVTTHDLLKYAFDLIHSKM